MRFGSVVITETVVNTWLIMLVIFIACRILTRGLTVRGGTKRQMVAEWIVTKVNGLVKTNMGEAFRDYPPLIAAIMALSALCSLSSMVGLYAPTSDLSTLVGWSLMVFVLITYYKIRANGFLGVCARGGKRQRDGGRGGSNSSGHNGAARDGRAG